MKNDIRKGRVTVLGIDLAKQSFQLHGEDIKRAYSFAKEIIQGEISCLRGQSSSLFDSAWRHAPVRIIGIGCSRRWGIPCV